MAPATPTDTTTPLALSSTTSHDPDQPTPGPVDAPSPEGAPSPTAPASSDSEDIETPPARDADPVEEAPDVIEETVDDVKETVDDVVDLSKAEGRLLELLNAERRAAGLREYDLAGDLVRTARDWSDVMASTGNFTHNPNLAAQLCCWTAWGENVAWGGVPDGWLMESTDGIHRSLMRSSSHRANILDPRFDQVGIGAVLSDGKLWVTQVFRRHAG